MLDLGFLEDVERILALTPSSRQTALFSATMPPEIRRLADQYLYDPVTIKVKTATLTVDTVEQFALEVAPRDKIDALVNVLEAERPEQAIVFVRTKIRCDQLYRTLRDRGHERPRAARRHDPGRPRRRDDLVQGREPAAAGRDRRGRPRARHLRHLARHQLRRARRLPTSTCTGSGAPAGSAAAAARSPSTSPASGARSRRSSATPGSSCRRGSRTRTSRRPPVTAPPRRHSKPHVSRQRRWSVDAS